MDLPSSGWPISASLEGSGSTLERVANLRLARGQRIYPRAGGQSPPRSRPSLGIRDKTAPPPNRPPYEGIEGQPLHHGSKGGRRQTATPAVDVTGVPSTDPGHRSATPVAVATLWSIQCGTSQVGTTPVTVLPTPTIQTISRWGRGPTMSRVLPRGALSTHGRDPGPPPCGVRDFHALPDLLVCTPALRPGGPGPSHAITTAGTLQDGRRHLHGTKDENPG